MAMECSGKWLERMSIVNCALTPEGGRQGAATRSPALETLPAQGFLGASVLASMPMCMLPDRVLVRVGRHASKTASHVSYGDRQGKTSAITGVVASWTCSLIDGGHLLQHYAVKTIENLISQGNVWAEKLATTEVASALLAILGAERKGEAARFTAASTLARLAHQTRDKIEMLNHILAYNGTALIITGAKGFQTPC